MTITSTELLLYAGALAILFLTPGPVWVGLLARSLSGGFKAAWPLALGVVVGDVIWSLFAVLGMAWVTEQYPETLTALKWIAAATFIFMGFMILRNASKDLTKADTKLTRPGIWAGFVAGLAVIIGNPKAILFYMGMLPGFFDLSAFTTADIIAVAAMSAVVPLVGNLFMAAMIDGMRRLLRSPSSIRKMNLTAGGLLVAVGMAIPFI